MPATLVAQRGRDEDVAGDGSDQAPTAQQDGLARPHRTFAEAADWLDAVLRDEPREPTPEPLRVGDDVDALLAELKR